MADLRLTTNPSSFTTFGDLLRFLRRRARLTQRALGIAVGYSESHINRFEKNRHLPDVTAVAALFIPELDLEREPALAARLLELAAAPTPPAASLTEVDMTLEQIPGTAVAEIPRPALHARARQRLDAERRLLLCGLAGMGKTTLAAQLARDYAQTMPVLWLTLTAGITNSADVLLRQTAVLLAAHESEAMRPLLTRDPRARAALSLEQQVALLSAALARRPVLLCFDDAELIQADEASRQILRHLAATTPAYLLLTARESLALPNVAEMVLPGFSADEAAAFIEQSAPHRLTPALSARLIERTGGSPMLLRLALGNLTNEPTTPGDGVAAAESFITRLETQPQVAAYLLRTVRQQISPAAWRLLLLLAVLQQPVNLTDPYLVELACTVGGIEEMATAVAELQRHFLIHDAAQTHLPPLLRDYVYGVLTGEVTLRRRLHRLAGDWFHSVADALVAAWHYSAAGLLDVALETIENNTPALVGRGQALPAAAVLDDVQAQLGRLRRKDDDLLRRLLALRGTLLAGTLRIAEGEASLRQAIALTGNTAVRANLIYQTADLCAQRSEFEETLRLVQAAQADLTPNDLLLQARLYNLAAYAHGDLGQHQAAYQAAQQALALADQMVGWPHSMVGETRASAHLGLASVARNNRDLTEAMAQAQTALTWARAAGQPRLLNLSLAYVGGMFYDLGDLAASFQYRQEGLAGVLAIGDVHSAAYVLTYLATIHFLWLETEQVLAKLTQAGETLRIVADKRGLAATESLRAHCLLWCGQTSAARQVAENMLQETVGKSTARMWGYRLDKLALVQLVAGEMTAAIATLQQALALPATIENPLLNFQLHGALAMAYTANAEPGRAAQMLAQAPRLNGLSIWAEMERDLIMGYVALADGDEALARRLAQQVAQRAEPYPLYRQKAVQLAAVVERPLPCHLWPQQLWVAGPSV